MNPVDAMIDACRRCPEKSRVRYRINSGEWQMASGEDFLALWDQPFAGTIELDHVYAPDSDIGGRAGGK